MKLRNVLSVLLLVPVFALGGIVEESGVKGGLVVCIGSDALESVSSHWKNEPFIFQCLETSDAKVSNLRKKIKAAGCYGKVSVVHWDGRNLPYAENLVNLIVASGKGQVASGEIERVLAPRGVAVSGFPPQADQPQPSAQAGKSQVSSFKKPYPKAMGEWPHALCDADNRSVAKDTVVGPPKRMQWTALPLYCRSHEIDSSISSMVTAGGRVYYVLDDGLLGIIDPRLPATWALYARDAFSGVLLWKKPLKQWGWQAWRASLAEQDDWTLLRGQRGKAPGSLAQLLVAGEDRLFATLGFGSPMSILDGATGKVLFECEDTAGAEKIIYHGGTVVVCAKELVAGKKKTRTLLVAIDPATGKTKWKLAQSASASSLCAAQGKVLFKTSKEIFCLDIETGKELWTKPASRGSLVLDGDAAISLESKKVQVFSLGSGAELWSRKGGMGKNPLVANGLIWNVSKNSGLLDPEKPYWDMNRSPQTGASVTGYDVLTGEKKKRFDISNLFSPGHHPRCYRPKGTDHYLLMAQRGTEFIDIQGDNHMRNDWVRGACKYGIMPANGMLYAPPNQCFCYTGVNIRGFNALAPAPTARQSKVGRSKVESRLVKGPAFGKIGNQKSAISNADWPAYRHDGTRSGSVQTRVSAKPKQKWSLELGGKLTQPVVAGNRLYIARPDEHELLCLDAKSGKKLWSFTAGGRIDSPPAVIGGTVVFGGRDGFVYCLDRENGQLAWRYRAAPEDRRVVDNGQVESAWPVNGAVLVKDGLVYASAGRHSFLDGGIHVCAIDPATGKIRHHTVINGPYPDLSKDIGEPFDMQGTFADVLVTDGTHLYMQQVMMTAELKQVEAPKITHMGDRKFGRHVFSTAGFLDGSEWNRTFWMNTGRYPGFYIANQAPKAGQLVVHDADTTYGVKCYTTRNVHSPMFFPDTTGYLLFADDNSTEPVLADEPGAPKTVQWLPPVNPKVNYNHKGKMRILDYDGDTFEYDKGAGFTRAAPPKWQEWVPVRIRAMVLANDTLFVAGPPDELKEGDPLAAFEGRDGGSLQAVATDGGKILSEIKLDSPPVFDGLVAAQGALFMATRDGKVSCYN